MSKDPKLTIADALIESKTMGGGLGAIAFGVLKALQVGGAEEKTLASVRVLMQQHFQRLSDEECNILCDVVLARLEGEKGKNGLWYGS